MRRLMREITELKNNPPEGIRVVTSEENMLDLTGIVEGPGESLHTEIRVHKSSHLIPQSKHRTQAGISGCGSNLHTNSPLHRQNVRVILSCLITFIKYHPHRLVCNQDFPPKRLFRRRDLCEHVEEGLATVIWHRSHSRDNQMPPYLSQSRECSRRGSREAPLRGLRRVLFPREAYNKCPCHSSHTTSRISDAIY